MTSEFKAKAWLKSSCPYCFRFLLFITEAGLLDEIEVIRVDADDEDQLNTKRAELQRLTGEVASFPTVELSPGQFMRDTDALIQHFADIHGINPADLPTLTFYETGMLPTAQARFKEIRALKEQLSMLSA
ncbi:MULTISPECIES: hypothetical protein [unclassified Oceanobacter]|jgi:hypothetical protein|uniref:hypothetical protein n=1 Tax=unclassified Oceanobacter TaxID=2620260 RepID=UPI0026E379E1|nr:MULTISPECIES: hypothetical protein [unclassified Oceanobacter]MDO6683756.1 hypothetical protein [Oceanobacter sp. 5_MG-2023]MDP2506262.1 hypothetical protein [Oceanobacter sp. 3_MG-2023]MDP2546476.1 hypothetical protein [Oceanobacter sp. 4_MG-2023]